MSLDVAAICAGRSLSCVRQSGVPREEAAPVAAQRSTGLGTWQKVGGRTCKWVSLTFLFSPTDFLTGTQKVTGTWEVQNGSDELAGTSLSETFDTSGTLLATACAAVAAGRVKAHLVPAPHRHSRRPIPSSFSAFEPPRVAKRLPTQTFGPERSASMTSISSSVAVTDPRSGSTFDGCGLLKIEGRTAETPIFFLGFFC